LIWYQLIIAIRVFSNQIIHLLYFSETLFIVWRLLNILKSCYLQCHRKINSFPVCFILNIIFLSLYNLRSIWACLLFTDFSCLVVVNILITLRGKIIVKINLFIFNYLRTIKVWNLNLVLEQTSIDERLWPDRFLIWVDCISRVLVIGSSFTVLNLLAKYIRRCWLYLTVLNYKNWLLLNHLLFFNLLSIIVFIERWTCKSIKLFIW